MQSQFELEPLHRNTPDGEFVDDLQRVARELGSETITISEYNRLGRFNASSLQRRFGSWHRALQRADLSIVRNVKVEEDRMFENLLNIWTRLGRQPRCADLTANTSSISVDTYKRRYGGWRKALQAFVAWANAPERGATHTIVAQNLTSAPQTGLHRTPRSVNLRLRFLVLRRDNFACQSCGRSPASHHGLVLQVDHVVAWENGGETLLANLQTLCEPCNLEKSNL